MNVSFLPMTSGHAGEVISWRYEAPYDVYDYRDEDHEAALIYLTDPINQFFAVLRDGEVIGFRSFGPDGRVAGGVYNDNYLDTGGGLRPDLTGKGLGESIIGQGIRFGAERFGIDCFRVTIAAFNQRAQKVCRRVGFAEKQRFLRTGDRVAFVILTLSLHRSCTRISDGGRRQGSY